MTGYIAVNGLMKTLKKCRGGWSKINNGYLAVNEVIESVKALPTADVAPVRHGRWKKAEPHGVWVYSDAYRQCSECNDVIYLAFKMQYCPTCGAKMDAEE